MTHQWMIVVFSVLLLGGNVAHGRVPSRPAAAEVDYEKLFSLLKTEEANTESADKTILGTPTIGPYSDFDIETDLAAIDSAIANLTKGGIAELIVIATQRSFRQRSRIFQRYFEIKGKLLSDVLADALGYSSEMFRGLQALIEPAPWRDAVYLYESMAGAGTTEVELNEIITTRSHRQLQAISLAYTARYKTKLTDDIAGDSWGIVETILVKLVNEPRKYGVATDAQVSALAQDLYDAGEGRWGRDDAKIVQIMTSESYETLRLVFQAYQTKFQTTFLAAIDSEYTRKARTLLMTLFRVILSTPQYFADAINTDTAGVGTDENGLNRHILSRADIDLVEIRALYEQKYKTTLEETIKGEVSGDYLALLLGAIVDRHHSVEETSAQVVVA